MIGLIGSLGFFVVFLFIVVLLNAIRVVREYERLVVFRLGRVRPGEKGPGLVLLIPIIDRAIKVGLRTVTMDVPPQDIITKDNVSVKVNAVIYFRVVNAQDAVIQVENYLYATSQIAQTTLRSILGQAELDELLSEREKQNQALQQVIDRQTEPRSRTSTCRRRCSARSRARPRPSASVAPRSSMPRASTRRRRGWPRPPR